MNKILLIKTSIFDQASRSSQLADRFVARWLNKHPSDELRERDFYKAPVPHLTAERFSAFSTPRSALSTSQRNALDYSDSLIAELNWADVIVLGLPMYNFDVPSMLKAYFDHVARVGVTFRYTTDGPVGLMENKQVYVLATRGGVYRGSTMDTQSEYVRNFFRFLGIEEVKFIYAEGLGIDEGAQRLESTHQQIDQILRSIAA